MKETELYKIMKNLKESEVIQMVITGGEPMLYPHLLIKGLELAKEFGIKCSVNSNLTLLTPEIAIAIKNNDASVLTSMLSYDQAEHDKLTFLEGSHVKLLGGIRLLIDTGVFVAINMVVMRQNLNDVYKTGRLAAKLGVKNFMATKVCPSLEGVSFEETKISKEDNVKIFKQLLKLEKDYSIGVDSLTAYPSCLSDNWDKYGRFLLKRNCSAGKTFCAISSNGQLRACVQHDKEYGSVIDKPISSIWPALKEWRDGSFLPDECKRCDYLSKCGGGCRATCQFHGDIKSMDPDANGCEFTPIQNDKNAVKKIDIDARLRTSQSLRFRKEGFGVILVVNGRRVSIVTNDSASLLEELSKKTTFTISQLLNDYNFDIELGYNFFSVLYKQKVLVLANSKEEHEETPSC